MGLTRDLFWKLWLKELLADLASPRLTVKTQNRQGSKNNLLRDLSILGTATLGQVGIYFRCNAQQVAIGKCRSHDAETDRSSNHSIEVDETTNKK